jgi:hypothetical protein
MADVRGLMERVALRGGTLDVDVRPAEGTTMTLRIAAVVQERQKTRDWEPSEFAGGSHPPLGPFIGAASRL